MTDPTPHSVHLRADGVSLLIHTTAGLPAVAHWGADLGAIDDADAAAILLATSRQTKGQPLDSAWQPTLLPQEADGWAGRPGFLATRDGAPVFPRWTVTGMTATERSLSVTAESEGLILETEIAVAAGGVVTLRHGVTNTGEGGLTVELLEATLPTPKAADRVTDFAGRWSREKAPHTIPVPRGSHARQTRRGRSGHEAPHLLFTSIGEPRTREGELWAVHLGWSADVTYRTDRTAEQPTLIGAGELLRAGEIRLQPGERYTTPTAYFAWSGAGLDGLSARYHAYLRARPQHPSSPRPLVLNVWEAVYFDHDPEQLVALAELAAKVGVERFVVDDGWFHARRDDTAGLGDWVVDADVWPDGLHPLVNRLRELGLSFGLWFEPEMVNLDSDLARAHPDWLLHNPAGVPAPEGLSWRNQFVLDLVNPDAYAHVRDQIAALVEEYGIDFIKWDHNRDLVEAVHEGRYAVHEQTLAVYRMIGELKARFPGLEIESCSSGGARTDLGILEVTDRVWASDSNDPVERQDIQRWTQLLLPPELVGGHVGPTVSHSSGRTTALSYRMITSLMGSAGFEWNIAECTPDELDALARWTALYRDVRHVIHGGIAVHPQLSDPALRVVGAVLPDASEAVFTIATVATPEDASPERIRLEGLDPAARYRVRVCGELGEARHSWSTPGWISASEVVLPGSALASVGLQIPALWPVQAIALHLTRV